LFAVAHIRLLTSAKSVNFPILNFFASRKHMKKETPDQQENASPETAVDELTLPQIEELQTRAAKADEYKDHWLRAAADLDNFKKRAARERTEAAQYASAALLQKLIPILDNFEMALTATQNAQGEKLASLQAGVAMIHQQFKNALLETGLEEVDASGQPFDPALHEAVSEQESSDVPEGHVLQQLRKGYKLKERLLRPATVVVAKKPAAKS
jgi:molecular chaperone GrpE